MLELSPKLEWVPVLAPDGKAYRYPQDDVKCLRKDYSRPAAYRWVLSGQGCKPQFLVGETGDLYKRLQAYAGSTAKRHVNIRRDFERVSASGGTVGLEILKFDTLAINGAVIAEDKLGNFFLRRALQNICSLLVPQDQLLTHTPERRAFRRIARVIGRTAEEVESAFRQVKSQKGTNPSPD